MPFVEAKCTNCGASLTVDNSLEAAVCDYCGTPYIVEKAINNFLDAKIGKIENANIIIHDEKSLEKLLDRADAFLNIHEDYDKACDIYESVTESYPREYRGWWGMICAKTCNFSYVPFNEGFLAELEYFFEHALKVAPNEEKNRITKIWNGYINKWNEQINNKIGQAEEELGEKKKKTNEYQNVLSELNTADDCYLKEKQIVSFKREIEENNEEIEKIRSKVRQKERISEDILSVLALLGYIFGFVIFFIIFWGHTKLEIFGGMSIVDIMQKYFNLNINNRADHFFAMLTILLAILFVCFIIITFLIVTHNSKKVKKIVGLEYRNKELNKGIEELEKSINNFHSKHSESSKLWDKSNSDEKGIEKKIIELKKMLKSVACPSCGVQLDCETEFCPQCGTKKY